ncbi:MAG: PAS domain S-box protein [Thermoplasmata archaeon]|nr:PAS domain S-box protein [Thermoplasmata archaeon]
MKKEKRKSGISVVGDVPWGTHLCQFYKTKEDLLDVLVPYFKAGLENNEFCMWVTSEPLSVEEAERELKKIVKDLDDYINKGQLEILDYSEWYTKNGKFDSGRVLEGWVEKEKYALQNGFDGLRLTGNTFWLGKNDWDDFKSYEETINDVIDKHRMIAICSYSLEKCNASEIIDVVSNHQFAIIRREGKWNIIESSERKKAEGQLKNSEQLYKNLIELAPDSIVTMDLKGYITSCNSAATRIFNYSKDDLVGKHFSKIGILHVKDIPKYLKVFVSVLRGKGTGNYELTVNDKDGTSRIVETHIGLIKENNKISGVIAITRDITERKQIEKEVIESEEKLKQILDSSPDAITVTDLNGNIIECNQTTSKIYGLPKAELIGKNALEFFSPKDREKAKDNLQKTFELGSIKNVEYTLLTKDGLEYTTELSASLIRDASGNPQSFVAITRDITERKRTEEEIKSLAKFPSENPNPVLRIKKDGEVIYSNKAGFQILDFWKTNIGEEVPERWRNIIRKKFASKNLKAEEEEEEEEVNDKIFSFVVSPVIDEGYVNLYGRDITERKQAEKELQQSEEKFRNYIECAPDGVLITDDTGKFIEINKAGCQISGYSKEEITKISIRDLLAEESLEDGLAHFRKVIETGAATADLWHKHKDSSKRCLTVEAVKLSETRVLGFTKDITERKKAEEALREGDEKWTSLTRNTNDIIMIVDNQGILQYINKTLPPYTPKETIGKTIYEYVPKDHYDIISNSLTKVFKTGEQNNFEVFSNIPKIGIIWFSTKVVPIKRDGAITDVILISTDITEQKRAEEIIVRSEKKFRELANSLPEIVYETDEHANFTFVNQTSLSLTGYTQEDFKSLNAFQMVAPIDRERVKNNILKVLQGKMIPSNEYLIQRKDGTTFPALFHSIPIIEENKIAGFRGFAVNITERKKAEENLRENEEKYRGLIQNSKDSIAMIDLKGNVMFANKATEKLTGYTLSEGVGMNMKKITPIRYWPKSYKALQKEKKGEAIPYFESVIKRKDGKLIQVETGGQPILKDGKVAGVQIITRDITERKNAEEKIKRQNIQLKKLDNIKTDFLNTTSHELRTPVASIKGYIQMLLKQTLGEITEEQKKALEVLLRNTNRLDHLIQDILDISRLESGTMKFITEKTDATKMVKEVAETMQIPADLKGIKINVDIQKGIPDLMIDQERMKQVLMNLVDNAIKFSPDGSMIHIKTRKEKEDVLFEVQDFGRGIPKNKQNKIFERFYQVDSGIDRKFGGVGLGLTISKKIIDTYGGQIWVDSTIGKGSSFKFSVPLKTVKNIEDDLQEIFIESP